MLNNDAKRLNSLLELEFALYHWEYVDRRLADILNTGRGEVIVTDGFTPWDHKHVCRIKLSAKKRITFQLVKLDGG